MAICRNNLVIFGGLLVGIMGAVLVKFGNPANMGLCFVCFYRDISGSLGLQMNPLLQYLRPEILGIFFGSFLAALAFKDFSPRGGSSPGIRFILGIFIMLGGLIFLGCPIRAIYRLAGGDLSAVGGLLGIPFGAYLGLSFLTKGYNLGRPNPCPTGWPIFPRHFSGCLPFCSSPRSGWGHPIPSSALRDPVPNTRRS